MAKWKRKENRYQQREQRDHGIQEVVRQDFPDKNISFKRQYTNKLSDVLVEFARPMLELCKSFEQEKKAIGLVILIWNAANIPELSTEELYGMLTDLIGKADPELLQEMKEIVHVYLSRKNQYFADDKRLVESYNLTNTKEGLHLEVAYRDPDRDRQSK